MDLVFYRNLSTAIREKFPVISEINSSIKEDGSVNRIDSTKENDKAIWLCIHKWEYKGNTYHKAIYGNWREGNQYEFKSYNQSESRSFKQKENKVYEETKQKLDQEKTQKHIDCRKKWHPIFRDSPEGGETHEYLQRKNIDGNYLARVNRHGVLNIPMFDDRNFNGLQQIFIPPGKHVFQKKFTYGIKILGSFCPFGKVREANLVYIAEGFATAASIWMALKKEPDVAVVAAMNTSNLLHSAESIRKINHDCHLVFAADKDVHEDARTNNIGERKAKYAASRLNNAIVKTVKFAKQDASKTDFNDLHCTEGIEKVKKQLKTDLSEFAEIIPLGFDSSNLSYFYSTERNQVLTLTASQYNANNLLTFASSQYWGDKFSYKTDKEGDPTDTPSWPWVIERLAAQIRKKGLYWPENVRAAGVWTDGREVLVNDGNKIWHEGKSYPFFGHRQAWKGIYVSDHHYDFPHGEPLTPAQALVIEEAFSLIECKKNSYYKIILGWVYAANLFNAINWRPHLWIYGDRGSGKSTILEYITKMIPFSFSVSDSTAHGIRQYSKNRAMAVIIDEAEPAGKKGKIRSDDFLALARQTSTRTGQISLRGTPGGKALDYNANSVFCVGSIQLPEMTPADLSRFFLVDLKSVGDYQQFLTLESAMSEAIALAKPLFLRCVKNAHQFRKNISIATDYLSTQGKIETRLADQLAPLISGYWGILYEEEITPRFVAGFAKEIDLLQTEYYMSNKEKEAEKCFSEIMSIRIPAQDMTVGQAVGKISDAITQGNPDYRKNIENILEMIGLKYEMTDGKGFLFVSNTNQELRQIMQRNESFPDYKRLLMRHPRYIRSDIKRVNRIPVRGKVMELG